MDLASRSTYRGQVTRLVKGALEYLNSEGAKVCDDLETLEIIEEELTVYLDRLTAAHENLTKANIDLREFIKPEDCEREAESIADYDDKAIGALTRLKQRLAKVRQRQSSLMPSNITGISTSSTSSNAQGLTTKLPKLHLKKFAGDFREWVSFWEHYRVAVHENRSLSNVDKFNYLQQSLTARAADTIAGLTPTEACYDTAISLLKEEFGNTEKIVDQTMQSLLALQPLSSRTDVLGLRRLYNQVMAFTRSLTALGISSENYFVMLKGVLLRCLPHDIRIDFHRYYNVLSEHNRLTTELSESAEAKGEQPASDSVESLSSYGIVGDNQVKCLLRFLKREVESLEKAQEAKTNSARSQSARSIKTAMGLLATSGKRENLCFFCNASTHATAECDCSKTLEERKQMLKRDGRCFKCCKRGHNSKSCKGFISCKNCKCRHATSVCDPSYASKMKISASSGKTTTNAAPSQETVNLCTTNTIQKLPNVYLQTALVLTRGAHSGNVLCIRIVMDGGSQISFIKSSVARRLNLPVIGTQKLSVMGFGSKVVPPSKLYNRVRLVIQSQYDNKGIKLEVVEVPEICADVLSIPKAADPKLAKFVLADACVQDVQPEEGISLLIGADRYWQVVTGEHERLSDNLTAINTIFGWTLQGPAPVNAANIESEATNIALSCSCVCEGGDFWNLEVLGISGQTNQDEQAADFGALLRRVGDRYVASLPWKENPSDLGDNKQSALTRLNSIVRKLSREPGKLLEYDAAMWEFISSGVAERATDESKGGPIYYMPHRPVYRADKSTTKVRVVFDASSHESNAKSLNELLETGTNLLPDILNMTLNFRCGRIGMVADIEKAFLQVVLDERDRDSHRFIWFAEKLSSEVQHRSLQVYRMTRVTFGVTCSPFLLGACILKHLQTESIKFPDTCSVLQQSFYMDDLVFSTNDREAAERLHKEAITLMKEISMNLRKWNTNDVELRRLFSEADQPPNMQKVLGVCWFVNIDELAVDLEPVQQLLQSSEFRGTKRQILQVISKIFDPLGILTPCTVRMKILFQSVWRLKLNWDERLPDDLLHNWSACCTDLIELKEMSVPRSVISNSSSQVQIHIFADASLHAYGAVAYVRATDCNGDTLTRFLCSKNRVAPLKENGSKELTLPKLELTAAVIAARLLRYFRQNLKITTVNVWLWTDSKITLYWIQGNKRKWKPYVANRVKEIRELSEVSQWRHCPGADNPADLLTRGITAKSLLSSSLWSEGPSWLAEGPEHWPTTDFDLDVVTPSLLMASQEDDSGRFGSLHTLEPLLSPENFSELKRLLRITAWVFRFINLSRRKLPRGCQSHLLAEEIQFSEDYWVHNAQLQHFKEEIGALRCGKPISQSSKIATLNPFLDNESFLRVGGRLQFMEEGTAHPVILPKYSHIALLIIHDIHKRTLHGGVTLVLTRLRERFWIPQGRQLIKSVIKECVVCRILNTKPASQPFAPLPRDRLKISRPFEIIGVDFAGPLYAKVVPNEESKKFYIMLFTCATIRAVHLELAPNLSTESCLLGLRRFIARRGAPSVIYSDNARAFQRASMELRKLEKFVGNRKLQDFLSDQRISWKFIVERAPWWGGFWERLIRIIKGALKATIGRAILNEDQLHTLLTEVEGVINTRPLTYVGEDPLDLEPLTPAHFLQGSAPTSLPSPFHDTKEPDDIQLRQLWKNRIRALICFKKRWRNEYLQQLRSLHHERKNFSSDVRPGDVVLLHDPSSPRMFWKLALVETIYPGRDGKIRSCLIRLHNGTKLRRPVQLLFPLELRSSVCPEDVEKIT